MDRKLKSHRDFPHRAVATLLLVTVFPGLFGIALGPNFLEQKASAQSTAALPSVRPPATATLTSSATAAPPVAPCNPTPSPSPAADPIASQAVRLYYLRDATMLAQLLNEVATKSDASELKGLSASS